MEKEETTTESNPLALARAPTPDVVVPAALGAPAKKQPTSASASSSQRETLVGQTAPSAQIDQWLQQTLSKMPVQSWNVTSSSSQDDGSGEGSTARTTAMSFERMAIAPERVEALNGPIMRVDRIDGETVDVNMNLHFRAHFGKGQLENSTASSSAANASANGTEDGGHKKGGPALALGEKAHDSTFKTTASGSSPRLVELRGDDEDEAEASL